MIVVDTNVVSYLFIDGTFTSAAEQAYLKDEWCAPLLWRSEFRNVLTTYHRHHKLPLEECRQLMAEAERLFWNREFTVRSEAVFDRVGDSRRSAYDCEFVALASELGISLVTTDAPVIKEFPQIAVHLRDYLKET